MSTRCEHSPFVDTKKRRNTQTGENCVQRHIGVVENDQQLAIRRYLIAASTRRCVDLTDIHLRHVTELVRLPCYAHMTFGPANQVALFKDHALANLALARSRSSPIESELDLYTPYNPIDYRRQSSHIPSPLQDPFRRCDRNLGWSIDWAVAVIVDRLQTTDAADALRNIRIRAASLEDEGLTPEIPFRIFNRLDEVLFAGYLKNAVFLDIGSLGSDVSGATYTHSWGPNTGVKRISIILNSDVLQYARAKDIVAFLIHHMIHAYFLVACGPQKEDEVDYGRLDHGVQFAKILLAIKKLSATHGRELTPLNFGHGLANMHYFANEYHSPNKKAAIDREDREKWYCSHCHHNVQQIPESDVEKWYTKICVPMFDQPKSVRSGEVAVYNDRRRELETKRRGRLAPSTKTVEFMFKEKAGLVETKRIDDFLGIRRAFDKVKSRYLKIHKEVSEATFLRLLEFIHGGSYQPDPRQFAVVAAAASLGIVKKGPPVIMPQSTTTQACLLADVQFAKLGTLMGFDECKVYALSRMNAYGVIYEDPVAILQEIYTGSEPDTDLKTWARKFLVRTPTPQSHEYHSAPKNVRTTDTPNLIKLESEQSPHRIRFFDAVESSGALENDVNKARAELKLLGWYDWPSLSPLTSPSLLGRRTASYSPLSMYLEPTRSSPLLLGSSTSPHYPWTDSSSSLTSGMSGLSLSELDRLRELERLREVEKVRALERERNRLREVEQERSRLERDRAKLSVLDREARTLKELEAQQDVAAVFEALFKENLQGRGRGFVEDEGRY